VRSLEDPELVARLSREGIPLTVCPLSNVALKVVDDLTRHPLPAMIGAGLVVSINSDDPAYFGGYIGDNYRGARDELGLDDATITDIARNSIKSSFLDDPRKAALLADLESVSAGNQS
jgi:adenosine deaminase